MRTKKYIDNKGFTTTDIVIAIIIIILFVSIITSAYYNYYVSAQSKSRKTIATNIIIDVIENVEMMNYDDVNINSVNELVNTLEVNGTIPKNYTVIVSLENYNEIAGNENKKDLIKILKVKVEYTISKKRENLEIKRLITKT